MKKCFKAGVHPNVQNQDDWTLLPLAAFEGHAIVVRFLLEHKADLSILDKRGTTARKGKDGFPELIEWLKVKHPEQVMD